MERDHIKRFSLSERQPHRDFAMNTGGPVVKTKDNVQPVIPPPRTVFIPHPQLAPPGMMGSRFKLAPPTIKEHIYEKAGENTFKSLVREREISRGPER